MMLYFSTISSALTLHMITPNFFLNLHKTSNHTAYYAIFTHLIQDTCRPPTYLDLIQSKENYHHANNSTNNNSTKHDQHKHILETVDKITVKQKTPISNSN